MHNDGNLYDVPHIISGKKVVDITKEYHLIHNPALGIPIGRVNFADTTTCNTAIMTAKKAFDSWAETVPIKRAHILFAFRDRLERYQSDLAKLVTQEHGKTGDDAKGSIARAIEVVEFHCGLLTQLQGSFTRNVATSIDCTTIRQPLGVCLGISPFNFPVMVPVWMLIPAIAAGNTFILKPSEHAPSTPVRLLELLHDAGLPDGIAQCVHGNKTVVDYLVTHPDIQAVTAVASTPVAKHIYTQATAHGKRAHTFGGAKNHAVVMPDADMTHAAQAIVGAAYGSAGERCMALSVLVTVGDTTAQAMIDAMLPLVHAIRIGPGDEKDVDMGPVIHRAQRDRIVRLIDEGVAAGATLLVDGRDFHHPTHANGYFLGPSLFDNVQPSMSIYREEIFGPVLIIVRVKTFEDALQLVNANAYGNGAAIFTRDGGTARTYSERVTVGMVGINIPIPVPIVSHPFGGWKQSSFGDIGMHGNESLHFYTRSKSITTKWPTATASDNTFVMPSHQEK